MKKSPPESKQNKTIMKNSMQMNLVNNMLTTSAQEKHQCKSMQFGIKESETKNQSTNDLSYLAIPNTEIFLKKGLAEEPIDLNPWCKEWTTSCLDEEILSSNPDVQNMLCIDHFTDLQTLQDPRSSTELSTSQQITSTYDDKSLTKEDIIYDFDQHILNVYSESRNNNNIPSHTFINMDDANMSQQVKLLEGIHPESHVWEVELQTIDATSFYLNKTESEPNNPESPNNNKLILSPAESDMFLETCTVVDPMKTFRSLNTDFDIVDDDGMELSTMNTSNEIFVEQSIDFGLISNNILDRDKLENIVENEDPSINYASSTDSNKPTLNLKLFPESSDCLVNTPDVIDNAISLESDFNLLSYIDNDTSISSISSDVTKFMPADLYESKRPNKSPKQQNDLFSESNLSKTLKAKKKQEKRGRPAKLPGETLKVEIIPGESEDDFKYRELRNKNNEASRRSRMLRKERETQILTTLQELEEHHQELIKTVSHLEEECNKYRSKLLDAMSK